MRRLGPIAVITLVASLLAAPLASSQPRADGSIVGVVRHKDGTPYAGAKVGIQGWGTVLTGPDGRYQATPVPPGEYRVSFEAPNDDYRIVYYGGYPPEEAFDSPLVQVGSGQEVTANGRFLQKAGRLAPKITDVATGDVIYDGTLVLRRPNGTLVYRGSVPGSDLFPPGKYVVSFERGSSPFASVTATFGNKQWVQLDQGALLVVVMFTSRRCEGQWPTIIGTTGDDEIKGTEGADIVAAGMGDDVVLGRGGQDVICLGDGNDTGKGHNGMDRIVGADGDDTILGGGRDDVLLGDDGEDTIRGGPGNDDIDGGDDADDVNGGGGDDQIEGGSGRDRLNGGWGDDTLSGGPQADFLNGGRGVDTLDGGDGSDTCKFGETLISCE